MNGTFTANDYRAAAAVLREHANGSEWIAFFEKRADYIEKRKAYAHELGQVGRADAPDTRGLLLLSKILRDGWTPPEGLF